MRGCDRERDSGGRRSPEIGKRRAGESDGGERERERDQKATRGGTKTLRVIYNIQLWIRVLGSSGSGALKMGFHFRYPVHNRVNVFNRLFLV